MATKMKKTKYILTIENCDRIMIDTEISAKQYNEMLNNLDKQYEDSKMEDNNDPIEIRCEEYNRVEYYKIEIIYTYTCQHIILTKISCKNGYYFNK